MTLNGCHKELNWLDHNGNIVTETCGLFSLCDECNEKIKKMRVYKNKGKMFVIRGECKCCGQCCSTSNWVRQATHEEADKFFTDTGIPHDPDIRATAYKQYHKKNIECMYFDPETKLCTIHKKRPEFCRNYPQPGQPLFKDCGYSFVEVYCEHCKTTEKDKTLDGKSDYIKHRVDCKVIQPQNQTTG